MRKLRLLLIAIVFFSVSLFSQYDYPEITSEELEQVTYIIVQEADDLIVVEVDGKLYVLLF